MLAEYLDRSVTIQLPQKVTAIEPLAQRCRKYRHTVKITLQRIPCYRFQRRLRAENLRRSIELRIDSTKRAKHTAADCLRKNTAHAFFVGMPPITPIPNEVLVPAVSGQRDRHPLPSQLADAISGNCRGIGKRLIVKIR